MPHTLRFFLFNSGPTVAAAGAINYSLTFARFPPKCLAQLDFDYVTWCRKERVGTPTFFEKMEKFYFIRESNKHSEKLRRPIDRKRRRLLRFSLWWHRITIVIWDESINGLVKKKTLWTLLKPERYATLRFSLGDSNVQELYYCSFKWNNKPDAIVNFRQSFHLNLLERFLIFLRIHAVCLT